MYTFELFPKEKLLLVLYKNVTNASEIRKQIIEGKIDMAFIDPTMVVSDFHVLIAANKALYRMKTKTIHTELVYNLGPSRNIAQTLNKFGVQDDSKAVLVGVFNPTDDIISKIDAIVKGERVDPKQLNSELSKLTDKEKLKNVFKIEKLESQVSSLLDSVVTRLAVRDI